MQTVASLAERLDMTAEEAVEKLRYMLIEVDGVESIIDDEQCDILIDCDDDPSVAERIRKEKLAAIEKKKKLDAKRAENLKKAAAKRKAKPAAKKKAAPGKAADAPSAEGESAPAAPMAELLPPAEPVAVPEEEPAAPVAELLPPKPAAPKPAVVEPAPEPEPEPEEPPKPSLTIGSAIEHDAHTVEVVRADGSQVDPSSIEEIEDPPAPVEDDEEEDVSAALTHVVGLEDEDERRRQKEGARPAVKPDPAVVAAVKRKALERQRQQLMEKERVEGTAGPSKTAKKKQRRLEKVKQTEELRRTAMANVKEMAAGGPSKKRRRRRDRDVEGDDAMESALPSFIEIEDTITVEQLANEIDVPVNELILELMDHDLMATKNQALGIDLVRAICEPKGIEVRSLIPEEEEIMAEEPDDPADLVVRPPVVTVMGHVDHGKTSLLDYIRSSDVAAGEAGGITQHIAAYEVTRPQGRIVFLDTPGHEAFTAMRARGAQATDVVVLVVAADDGVMPQTIEAIDHAKAAEVPIVVAVNKCDKEGAEPERIRQELTRFDLVDEAWGGKTIMRNVSAITGDGIDDLMEMLVLESELLELKANPKKSARGVVVESEVSQQQGSTATILVQNGTLRVGDSFLCGTTSGRVRTMINSRGKALTEAPPATPVVVTGFETLPEAGDQFIVVADERMARNIAAKRAGVLKAKQSGGMRQLTLEDLQARLASGEANELNVVLKADVQGSVDVLSSSLQKLGNEEVRVKVVRAAAGGVNEGDVLLASASEAIIIGFNVVANPRAAKLAEQEGIEIRTYRVIYEAIQEVQKALEGMLEAEKRQVITGHAEVRRIFKSSAVGTIAGCSVRDGEMTRNSKARLLRDEVVVYEGSISSLKREREDARTVATGFECGITLENFDDVKEGDVIETFRIEEVARTLV